MRLFSRVVHAITRWNEDRSVPEASTVRQIKALYARPVVYRNLKLVRGDRVRRSA